MSIKNVTNEVASKVALFGTEVTPGVPVVPTGALTGTWEASRSRALVREEEATGSYDRMTKIKREAETYSGSYSETPSFESLPSLFRYGVAGGDNPTADANAEVAYTRVQTPSSNTDDVDTMTIVSGVEGLPFEATGVRWDEWTLSWSATGTESAWQFSGNPRMTKYGRLPGSFTGVATAGTTTSITMTGAAMTVDEWVGSYIYFDYGSGVGEVRVVIANTADTLTWDGALSSAPVAGMVFHVVPQLPIVNPIEHEVIKGDTVDVYVDLWKPDGTAIGSTLVSERVLEFSIGQTLNTAQKRRAAGIIGRVGRGARWYTGNVRFEFDRWDEYKAWDEDDFVSLRFEKKGSIIDPTAGTTKLLRLDTEKVAWDVFTEDSEEHNMTATLSYVAANPIGSPNPVFRSTIVNTLATLP